MCDTITACENAVGGGGELGLVSGALRKMSTCCERINPDSLKSPIVPSPPFSVSSKIKCQQPSSLEQNYTITQQSACQMEKKILSKETDFIFKPPKGDLNWQRGAGGSDMRVPQICPIH